MKRFPYIFHALVCIVLVLLDQLTKVFARTTLKKAPIVLWDGVFELYYHENRGSIWGILQGKIDFLFVYLQIFCNHSFCHFYITFCLYAFHVHAGRISIILTQDFCYCICHAVKTSGGGRIVQINFCHVTHSFISPFTDRLN